MLTMFEIKNPELIFKIDYKGKKIIGKSIENEIKQSLKFGLNDAQIKRFKEIKVNNESCEKVFMVEHLKEAGIVKLKIHIKNNSGSHCFKGAVVILTVNNNKEIDVTLIFNIESGDKSLKFVNLKENRNEFYFLKDVFSEFRSGEAPFTELNINKIKKVLKNYINGEQDTKILFNTNEIMPYSEIIEKKDSFSYHPVQNINEKDYWEFGYNNLNGIYLKEVNVTLKGVVFKKEKTSIKWFLSSVSYYPGDVDLPPKYERFRAEVTSEDKSPVNSSFSLLTKSNDRFIFNYVIKNGFDVDLVDVDLPNRYSLFGIKDSLKNKNLESSYSVNVKGITEVKELQMLYNYLSMKFRKKENIICQLFNEYLNDEIIFEDLITMLDINTGLSKEKLERILIEISNILKVLNKFKKLKVEDKCVSNPFEIYLMVKDNVETEVFDAH